MKTARRVLNRRARWVVLACGVAGATWAILYSTGRPSIEDDPRLKSAPAGAGLAQEVDWAFEGEGGLARAEAALRETETRHGRVHPATAEARLRVADIQRDLGRLPAAAEGYDRAAQALAERGEPDHWIAREARGRRAELEPTDGPARARELYRVAAGHLRRGRYAAAVGPAKEALEIRRGLPGAPRADLADSLLQLGRVYLNRDDHYRDAGPLLEQARDACAAALGPGHPLFAACFHEMGTLEEDRGDFFTANQFYSQALVVLKAARGELSADYARTLARQGRMHAAWWVTEASGKIMRAQQIREQILGKDHPDYAESLQDLGLLALNQLNFELAIRLGDEALAVREKALGPDHPDLAETLILLGRGHERKGDYLRAHRYLRRALAVVAQACGRRHLRYGNALSWSGWVHDSGFDNVRAVRLYEEERAIRTAAGADRHPDYAFCLFNLGSCMTWIEILNQLAYENADPHAEAPPADRLYTRGRILIDEAAALLEKVPGGAGTRLPAYVMYLTAPAWLDYHDGYRYKGIEEAGRVLAKAEEIVARYGGERYPYVEHVYSGKTRLLLARGDIAGAREAAQRFSGLITSLYGTGHQRFEVQRLGILVEVEDRAGDFGRLEAALRTYFDKNRELTGVRYAPIERTLIEWLNRNHRVLSVYLATAAAQSKPDMTRPYGEVLAFRGEVASRQARLQAAARRPELRATRDRLYEARSELTRHAFGPIGIDERAWLEEFQTRIDVREDAEAELIAANSAVPPPPPTDPIGLLRDVQRAIPGDGVLIDYFRIKQPLPYRLGQGVRTWTWQLVAFVVRGDRPPEMVPLGPLGAIEEAVAKWRARIQEGADPTAEGRKLAGLIWNPLARGLGATKSVFVVPDGPICGVPFAALPGANDRLLIEDYTISYLPAARIMADRPDATAAPVGQGLLVTGGIDYGTTGGGRPTDRAGLLGPAPVWERLPAAGEEARRVGELFARSNPARSRYQLLDGSGADAPALLGRLAEGYRHVHFAGHAFFAEPTATANQVLGPNGGLLRPATGRAQRQTFNRHSSLLSGLVLAGANGPGARADPDRCYLTAERVSGLDLRGTELVTLSACDTGLGNLAGGEGVLGLQRAFHAAGARAVVTSLWKVHDAATSVLMDEFYTNLWHRGLSKREALRQAQLTVCRSEKRLWEREQDFARRGVIAGRTKKFQADGMPNRRGCHPEFWAAFVLSGADGVIPLPEEPAPGRGGG